MRQGRHFKQRWKELLAVQGTVADGREETAEDEDGLDGSPVNLALAFIRRYRRGLLIACLCVVSLCAAMVHFGRFGSSADRRPLHGRVQVDGVGVAHGSISFLPTAGNSGPAANGSIVNGEYNFTKESGPRGGPHRVLIDIDSLPGQDDEPIPAQPKRDMKRIDTSAVQERRAEREPPTKQPQRSSKRHWEVEYAVPEEAADQKDFELGG
jgi:hypothetical protein